MTTEVESKEQEEADNKVKQELVKISFKTGRNGEIEREVYPEIAKFIASRREAEQAMRLAQRAASRARQEYIWKKEDEFFADSSHAVEGFDDYNAGREWDRQNIDMSHSAIERRYVDFTYPSRRGHPARPNSWDILHDEAQEAGHKEVVWIVDHCLDNNHEASLLLRYLPATVDELWKAAKEDHDMCVVFDRYMEQALAAGVLTDKDIPAAVREMSAMMNWFRRNFSSASAGEARTHVRRIVAVEREAAVAEAREQWDKELLAKYAASQDMRELLRSLAQDHPVIQTHLNRSDAARRVAEARRANREVADRLERVIQAEEAEAVEGLDHIDAF